MVRVALEEQDEGISVSDHEIEMEQPAKLKERKGESRMKAEKKRYQLKVKNNNYWATLQKPTVLNQLKNAIQEETTEETLVKIQEFVHKKCRYMRKYFQQTNQLNGCKCTHNEDIMKLYKTKDYQKIDSQVYSIRRRNVSQEVKSSYQEKVVIKRRILNDYMNIINKRQVIVQEIQENLESILEMHQDLLQYYNTYYSKRNNKQFYRLQQILLPEFRYILKFISNKGRQFETRIKNFVDPSQQQAVAKKQEDQSNLNTRSNKGAELKKAQSDIILAKSLSSKEDEHDSEDEDKGNKISALQQKLIQQKARFQNLAKSKGYFFLENTEEINNAAFNGTNSNNNAEKTNKYASFEAQKYGSDKMKLKIFQNDMKKFISHEKAKGSEKNNSKYPATALNSPNKTTNTRTALNKTQSCYSKSTTNKMESKSAIGSSSKQNQNNKSDQFFMSQRNPKFNQLSLNTSPKSSLRQSINASPVQSKQLSPSKDKKTRTNTLTNIFETKQDPVQFTEKNQLKSIIPGMQENQIGGTRLSTRFGVKSNKSDTMQYSSHTRIKSMGSFTQIIGMKEFANFSTQPLPHQGVTQFRRFKEKYFQQSDSKEDDVKPRFQQLSLKDLRTNSNPSLPLTIKELKNSLLNSNNNNPNGLSPYLGQYGSWGATTLIPESEDEQTPKESSLRHHSFLRVPGINTTFRSDEESAEDNHNQDPTSNMKRSYFAAPKINSTNSPREKQSSIVSDLAKEDVFIYKKLNRIYLEKIYDERILNRKSFRNINPPHSPDQIKALMKRNSTARIFPQPSISNNLIPSSENNKNYQSNNISSFSNVSGVNLGKTVNGNTTPNLNLLRECKSQPYIPNILRHFSKEEQEFVDNSLSIPKPDHIGINENSISSNQPQYKKTNSFEKNLIPSSSLVLTVPNVGLPISIENFTSIKEITKPDNLAIPPSLSLDIKQSQQPKKIPIFQISKKSIESLSSSSSSEASSLNTQREFDKPITENTVHQQQQKLNEMKVFKKQSNSPQNESLSTNASFPSPSQQAQVQYPCIRDHIIQEQAMNKNDNNMFLLKLDKHTDSPTIAAFQENNDKVTSKKTKKLTLPISISPPSKKHITPVSMSPREVATNAFSSLIDKLGERVTSQKLEMTKLSEQIENSQKSQEKLFSNIKKKFNTCLNKREKAFRQYMKEIDMPFEDQIRILNNEKNQSKVNESSNNGFKQWNQLEKQQQPQSKQQSPQSLPPKTPHSQSAIRFYSSNKTSESNNTSYLGTIPQNIEELLLKTKKFNKQRMITSEQSVNLTLKLSEFESRLYHKNISSFFPKNK